MTDIYQGDPTIEITPNGAELPFYGEIAQPVMDQGVENYCLLALFAPPKWAGNFYATSEEQKLISEYEEISKQATTLSNLEDMRQETIKRLNLPVLGEVTSNVTAPASNQKSNVITVNPPSTDPLTLQFLKNGDNWINQAAKGIS